MRFFGLAFTAAAAAIVAQYYIRPQYTVHKSGLVFITGASSGIGQSLAVALAKEGFTVLAGVRKDTDAKHIIGDTAGFPYAHLIKPIIVDVTQASSLDSALEATKKIGMPLVGVVCNAGISAPQLPVEFRLAEEDAKVFAVNYFGAAETAKRFIPLLRESKGRLVLTGSLAGNVASAYGQPYSASKFAVRSLGDSLRRELAPFGVFVARVEPGFIETPILTKGSNAGADSGRFIDLSSVQRAPYEEDFKKMMTKLKATAATPSSTDTTNRDFVHALTAARPKPVYHPGSIRKTPARVFVALMNSLDAAWQDFFLNSLL